MADLSEKIIEAGARAISEYDGDTWDIEPERWKAAMRGQARAALLAVLPMVAEEIADMVLRGDHDGSIRLDPKRHASLSDWFAEQRASAIRARFSSLIEDLKT